MNATSLPASLKGQRTGQSLTIEQLSKRSGVSRAMISKIERGEATPTTSTLGKLAEALDVSISQMVGGPKEAGLLLTRHADQPVFTEPGTGFSRRSLSPLYRGRGVDFVLNTLPPGKATGPFPSHRPGVEEHLYVQSGKVAIIVGDERHELNAGDFLFYPGDQEHVFQNIGDEEAAFFIVIDNKTNR
jgi:transcriptional regulator with XRE-family HTH domain